MIDHDGHRRIRIRRRMAFDRETRRWQEETHRMRLAVAACCLGMVLAMLMAFAGPAGRALAREESSGCRSLMDWPVAEPAVIAEFEGPPQPWMSGHRGIDLTAPVGTILLAPADGTITFTGTVAGKAVVSLRTGASTLTFEPADTDLGIGAAVRRGQSFAVAAEGSDHCDGRCVHWGVRRGATDYIDPRSQVIDRRVALKPIRAPS